MAATVPRSDVITVGELTIALPNGPVFLNGRALMLSIREFGMLLALARAEGRILSRAQLYRDVWGKQLAKRDRSVDVYVHKLRAKLDAADPDARFIHTHIGFGYRLAREPADGLQLS